MKSSTTGPGATVTLAASVRRPSNRPRREDRICLRAWGHSITPIIVNRTGKGTFSAPLNQLQTHVQAMCLPLATAKTGTG
ncbi:hypothetical protein BN1007_150028 [Klebsiella variicola]|nr:hypothetical protein BN1007_150028 [Klebsiella variicola]